MVPMPPITIQLKIAEFINKEEIKINSGINLIQRSIGLLREYRSSLITAAVSGQIDVSQGVSL